MRLALFISLLLHGLIFWYVFYSVPHKFSKENFFIQVAFLQKKGQKSEPSHQGKEELNEQSVQNPITSDAVSHIQELIQNTIRYPPRARALGWQGKVTVLVKINSSGKISEIIFLEKDSHEDFNQAVEEALLKWQLPLPKEKELVLTFRFVLKENGN